LSAQAVLDLEQSELERVAAVSQSEERARKVLRALEGREKEIDAVQVIFTTS
jgi:hypothetical protein